MLYQIGLIAKRDMELAPSLSGGFDMALLRMVSFIPNEMEEVKKKVEPPELENKTDNFPKISNSENSPEDLKEEKEEISQKIKEKNFQKLDISSTNWMRVFGQLKLDPGTKQLASHCSFIKSDETVIYLSMPSEKLSVFSGKHRKQLQDALSSYYNTQCNLFLEEGDYSEESPNQIKEEEKRKEIKQAQREIEQDPNVQRLVEVFGAKVLESSIEPRTEK
jgi:DNA polymerase-3 subunit gamma/tau